MAEVFGVYALIALIASLPGTIVYSLSSEPSKLYDTTDSWKRLLVWNKNFIKVSDIPYSSREPTNVLLEAVNDTNIVSLIALSENLPTQKVHTIRVYFAENIRFRTEGPRIDTPSDTPSFAGSPAMISQWRLSSKKVRWETHSYRLSLLQTRKKKGAYEQHYIDSVSIAAGTIRRTLKCMLVSTEDGRITFYIDATSMVQEVDLLFDRTHIQEHQMNGPSPEAAYTYHKDFCESLENSIKACLILGTQVATVPALKKLFLLHYCHALVKEYTELVYNLQANYARQKGGLSDPRRVTLTSPMLAEITRDICFYDEVKDGITELAGAVDAVVESLEIHLEKSDNYSDFRCLAVDLQSTCTDLKRTIITLSTTLENRLRLFELSRSNHEAQNVRLLSILASIFLPLSLACGLLSMQTRFSHLHYLLYDFFEVLVLLGTVVIVILIAIRVYLWWQRLLTQLDRNRVFRQYIRPTGHILTLVCLVFWWGLLISSFLVGMVKDVGLGLKILGYGAAAAGGFGLLAILIPVGVLFIWSKLLFPGFTFRA